MVPWWTGAWNISAIQSNLIRRFIIAPLDPFKSPHTSVNNVLIPCHPYPVPINDLCCVLPIMSYPSFLALMITDHIYHLFIVLCYMPTFIGVIMHACFNIVVLFFLCTNPTPFGCYDNKAIIIIITIIIIIIIQFPLILHSLWGVS